MTRPRFRDQWTSAQASARVKPHSLGRDQARYIDLSAKYDVSRDIRELAAFIPIRQLEECADWFTIAYAGGGPEGDQNHANHAMPDVI